ncbi:MAG: chorismate mutase, partial [Flavobacteriales bacterium]
HRVLIDRLDEEILQKVTARMEISERIGLFKQAHNIAILQPERWRTIMQAAHGMGKDLGLSRHFIQALMDAVHDESIRKQTEVWEREQLAAGYQGSTKNVEGSLDTGHGTI